MLSKETILAQAKQAGMDPVDYLLRLLELKEQEINITKARLNALMKRHKYLTW